MDISKFSTKYLSFSGDWELPHAGVSLLIGENGVGKTTLLEQMKKSIRPSLQKWVFLDQMALRPLGGESANDLIDCVQALAVGNELDSIYFKNFITEFFTVDLLDRPLNKLSGGENQWVKLALCFCRQADIYFLDEPFNHLDKIKSQFLAKEIQKHCVVVVDHREGDLLGKIEKKYFLVLDPLLKAVKVKND